ncbi:PilZ domain-containing protein [Sphingorhabdus sp.]|uniref:PilZ domain-containing protein n=1 Tax=Sphingorhabdus sp. TaxID=1902408 RepID=UPI0037CB407F
MDVTRCFNQQAKRVPRIAKASQNSDAELRSKARHRASHKVIAESRQDGEKTIHIVNVSAHGFMIDGNPGYQRAERVERRLPVIGRIEALVTWTVEQRLGLQFERALRLPDFLALLDIIGPKTG